MKEKKYLVGVDGGTTGAKTGIYDFEGTLVGLGHVESDSLYPQPGFVENDPEVVKRDLFESCRLAIKNAGIDPDEIAAISVSAPSPVLVFLDENLQPMRNLMGWQDARSAPYVIEARKTLDLSLRRQISGAQFSNLNVMGRLMWMREHQPEIFEKAFVITDAHGYLLSCFGAKRIVIDMGSAGRLQLIDIRKKEMSQQLADMFDFSIDRFPELIESGIPIGTVSKEAAMLSGLREGTPLIVGAHDQVCNQTGIGALRNGDVGVNSGTFGNCMAVTDHLPEKIGEKFVYKCNTNLNSWTVEGMALASAMNFKWFRDTVGVMEKAIAKDLGENAYEILAAEANCSVPGANGVTYLPHLSSCTMGSYPTADARATLIGMTLTTSKCDMVRAVMEGICYDLYDLAVQQQAIGCVIDKIRLSGGVTRSPIWCQMFADIFGKPVELTATEETGTLGAAMFAGVGISVFKDILDAADKCVHVVKTYLPHQDAREAYDQGFVRYLNYAKKLNT